MKLTDFMNHMNAIKNGVFFDVIYETNKSAKLLASERKNGTTVTKRTYTNCRKGILYDNMKAVKEKRENGELPPTNGGLNGFEWVVFELLLKNKKGELFARLYPCNNPNKKSHSTYFVNGVEKTKDELKTMGIMQPSFFNSNNTPTLCYNVRIDDIISIN